MQQGAQVVVVVRGPDGVDRPGCFGQRLQAIQAAAGKGPQGVADGLGRTAQGGGDLGGPPALVAVQQDLAAAQGKGVWGAEALPEYGKLAVGERSNEER